MTNAMTNRKHIPLTPLGDRLAVILDPKVAESKGGIIIPDRAQERPSWGTVVSHGPDTQHCMEGDRVYVPTHLGTSYLAGDANLVIINEAKVLAREERIYKLATGQERTEAEIDSGKVVQFEPRKPWAEARQDLIDEAFAQVEAGKSADDDDLGELDATKACKVGNPGCESCE